MLPKLKVFSHGFFQDILTLMNILKTDAITKTEIGEYLRERLKELDLPLIEEKKERKENCTSCEERKRRNAEAEAAFVRDREKAKKRKEVKLNERI